MTSNISRYALWIVLGYALWINYQAWLKDYTAVDTAAAAITAAHVHSGGLANEIPQSGADNAPGVSAPAASAAASGVAAAPAEAVGALAVATSVATGPAVHVHTDVLDLNI